MKYRALFLRQEAIRRTAERTLRAKMARELKYVAAQAASHYPRYDGVIAEHALRLHVILLNFYGEALGRAIRELEMSRKAFAPTPPDEDARAAAKKLATQWASKNAIGISTTTRHRIDAVVSRSVAASLTDAEIAEAIERRTGGSVAGARALTIARTEAHAATQAGGYEAAKASGVISQKQWVAAEDDRTRETHAEADGQIVDVDEPFIVGGTPLDYPGDPSGDAAEVVNCRCVVRYVIKETT